MDERANELLALSRMRGLVRSGAARTIRANAGLSLAEMARAAEVSVRSIIRWEAGTTVPHGDAAVRYGRLLDHLLVQR